MNVDIPIDIKRIVRISFYASKIDLVPLPPNIDHWIGLREKIQETMIFTMAINPVSTAIQSPQTEA